MEKKNILIVEDDLAIRILLSDCLSQEGHHVATAIDGSKALEYLSQNPPPCLILLDLMMPIMDGMEFRSIQLQNPLFAKIPVIVITAGIFTEKQINLLQAKAYLKKPFDIDKLIELVNSLCVVPLPTV